MFIDFNCQGCTDAMVLHDNINKINKRLCQIYDLRERKIVIAALNGVSGSQQPKDMTKKESELYAEVIDTLKRFRDCPADAIPTIERQATIVPKAVPQVAQEKPAEPAAVAKAEETEGDAEPEEAPQTCLVRVLEEVPPFVDVV